MDIHDIGADVKEIKTHVVELVKQGAIHNHILSEHEKRSTLLEQRIQPIEDDYKFRAKVYAVLLGSSGIAAFAVALFTLYRYIKS